jgi:hypothetical protein
MCVLRAAEAVSFCWLLRLEAQLRCSEAELAFGFRNRLCHAPRPRAGVVLS